MALQPVPGRGVFEWIRVGYDYLPGVQQEQQWECGPACIGILLHMKDHPAAGMITLEALRTKSRTFPGGYEPGRGVEPGNLVAMLHYYGFRKSRAGRYPQIRKMLRETSTDFPLIVATYFPQKHFVVSCGYDKAREEYLFSDPAHGVGAVRLLSDRDIGPNMYRYPVPNQRAYLRGFFVTVQ